MNPIKQRRITHRKALRKYLRTLSDDERRDADGWNGAAVAAAKGMQGNPSRVLCIFAERPDRTRRQTLIGRADDKLSRLASAVAKLRREESAAFDDPITQSAPGECWRDISRGYDSALDALAQEFGFADIEAATEAMQERTTGRWMYFTFDGELCQSDVSEFAPAAELAAAF